MDQQDRMMMMVGLTGLTMAATIGGLVYVLHHISPAALRWWAGAATAAVPLAIWGGYAMGRLAARERLTGLEQGVDAVMRAAERTANLRVATVREVREIRRSDHPPESATHPAQVVIVPALPRLASGQGHDVVEV